MGNNVLHTFLILVFVLLCELNVVINVIDKDSLLDAQFMLVAVGELMHV